MSTKESVSQFRTLNETWEEKPAAASETMRKRVPVPGARCCRCVVDGVIHFISSSLYAQLFSRLWVLYSVTSKVLKGQEAQGYVVI